MFQDCFWRANTAQYKATAVAVLTLALGIGATHCSA
jgi:hypothetical protein